MAKYVGAEPFRPFRINMASGRVFEIRHPELVRLGRRTRRVFTYLGDSAEEKEHEVSLLLIESVEPIEAKPAATLS